MDHAHPATVDATLADLLRRIHAESAAIVIRDSGTGERRVIASTGLPEIAVVGLTAAMGDPEHPVSASFDHPTAAFDVLPTRVGGPKLRSHVPIVAADSDVAIAVLAIAHDGSLDDGARQSVDEAAHRLAILLLSSG